MDTEALTVSQAARRERVIAAAMELGADGGYDAVQMRDVATTAGVALGTIYRYFSSKDHLLAASMVDWSKELEARVTDQPPAEGSAADRVVAVIRGVTSGMEQQPKLAAAVVNAVTASDPAVVECQREMTTTIMRVLAAPIADLPDAERDGIVRVLAHVWNSTNLGWVNGWLTVGQVGDDLEQAARLLLRDTP
ncbi:MAG: TetR/AcrR family transcriptional regulator [Acidimicrobiales bacterium]|nr:TetR/AcrR family transcriptional regulator [Acidimicrobiales bacterium]